MHNEEFQRLVLEQLGQINNRLTTVEANMATKDELAKAEAGLKTGIVEVRHELSDVKTIVTKTNMHIENDIWPAIKSLGGGHQQQAEQIQRIEQQVCNQQEEFIIKRIK